MQLFHKVFLFYAKQGKTCTFFVRELYICWITFHFQKFQFAPIVPEAKTLTTGTRNYWTMYFECNFVDLVEECLAICIFLPVLYDVVSNIWCQKRQKTRTFLQSSRIDAHTFSNNLSWRCFTCIWVGTVCSKIIADSFTENTQ